MSVIKSLIINYIIYFKKSDFFNRLTSKMITHFPYFQAKIDFFILFFFTILLVEKLKPEEYLLTYNLTKYQYAQRSME